MTLSAERGALHLPVKFLSVRVPDEARARYELVRANGYLARRVMEDAGFD
jgi:hypothetical protein